MIMFGLVEEDTEEDLLEAHKRSSVAIATHELQDSDYDSPHLEAEVGHVIKLPDLHLNVVMWLLHPRNLQHGDSGGESCG